MSSIPYSSQVSPASPKSGFEEASAPRVVSDSYGQILKSTAWVGGSTVLNIVVGIARTKVMALLLGPGGFGLAGLYMSVSSLTQSIAGMGINSSGVRQIAEAVGSEDNARIAITATVLRRASVALGLVGAGLLALFARPVSRLTFGNDQHVMAIYALSIGVFFSLVSAGQGALIQGMRRISDLAKLGVLGAFLGTILAVPIVYFFRAEGVVPALVAVAAMTLLTSWWYSRRIGIDTPSLSILQVSHEASGLLKLGFAFMVSNMLMMGSAYAVRLIVMREIGIDATGLYQAAWTVGGMYVGLILQSMGADFYPRLTAVVNDHPHCNRLVNEQTRVSLLLAGPGVIATLTAAPLVISILYAANFSAAVDVLRWICLGVAMRVISWPMGFIIMSKGRQGLIIFCEVAWIFVHLGLAWMCVRIFGLIGAGIAFFGSYVFHIILTYSIVRRLSGFNWVANNRQPMLLYSSLIAAVFCGFYVLPQPWAYGFGTMAALLSAGYSIRILLTLVSLDRIPRPLRRILLICGLARMTTTPI